MLRKFKISVDGRPYDVTVEELEGEGASMYPDTTAMARSAQPVTAPAVSEPVAPAAAPAPQASAEAAPGDIVSPLAGVVHAISVAVGDDVGEDTQICIIEAMKMKTVVAARCTGKVTAIAVSEGDGVEAGQVLMTVA